MKHHTPSNPMLPWPLPPNPLYTYSSPPTSPSLGCLQRWYLVMLHTVLALNGLGDVNCSGNVVCQRFRFNKVYERSPFHCTHGSLKWCNRILCWTNTWVQWYSQTISIQSIRARWHIIYWKTFSGTLVTKRPSRGCQIHTVSPRK